MAAYVRKDKPDEYYVRFGRIATVLGVVVAIGTSPPSSSPCSGSAPPLGRLLGAGLGHPGRGRRPLPPLRGPLDLGSPLSADFWGAVAAFVVDVVVTVAVSLVTQPKPDHELRGLVWSLAETEEAERRDQVSGMASLFDLRVVIGGLLVLYGLILTVMGVFASDAAKAKAAGININLWADVVLLAGGAVFLLWARLRPLRVSGRRTPGR